MSEIKIGARVRLLDRSGGVVGLVVGMSEGERRIKPWRVQVQPGNPRSEFYFAEDELKPVPTPTSGVQ